MADSEWVIMTEGVKRQIRVDGEKMMLVEVRFEAGAAVPQHSHPHEQISYVASGRMLFTVDGQVVEVASGDSLHLPSNVPHAARALEASTVLDTFSPPREDFRK
jgi:quercetin dioxygenase-like cupin family protein